MKRVFSILHQYFTILILVGVVFEFFFAGIGVFHASSFQIHRITGVSLWAASALLLLLALFGRTERKTTLFSLLLFVLMFIQPLLLQIKQPFVQALHPVNGLAIMANCVYLVRLGIIRLKKTA